MEDDEWKELLEALEKIAKSLVEDIKKERARKHRQECMRMVLAEVFKYRQANDPELTVDVLALLELLAPDPDRA